MEEWKPSPFLWAPNHGGIKRPQWRPPSAKKKLKRVLSHFRFAFSLIVLLHVFTIRYRQYDGIPFTVWWNSNYYKFYDCSKLAKDGPKIEGVSFPPPSVQLKYRLLSALEWLQLNEFLYRASSPQYLELFSNLFWNCEYFFRKLAVLLSYFGHETFFAISTFWPSSNGPSSMKCDT